jgi:hypothetical protein
VNVCVFQHIYLCIKKLSIVSMTSGGKGISVTSIV